MILVTGSTGTVGKEVVRELKELGADFHALVHDPAKAVALKGKGVEPVIGDFNKLDSVRSALQGIKTLFLLTPPSPDQPEVEGRLVEEARSAGVKYIVKLSAQGAGDERAGRLGRWHGDSEKRVKASGLAYTHLRPNYFMQNLLLLSDSVKKQRAFYLPAGEARLAMVDARDIGAVAARVLTGKGHEGQTYEVTGPESLGFSQVAEKLTAVVGKPVKYISVPDPDGRRAMVSSGMPDWLADALIELHEFFRLGGCAATSDAVAAITGRPPRSLDVFLRENASAFKG